MPFSSLLLFSVLSKLVIHNFWKLGPSGVKGTINILKIYICFQPVTDECSAQTVGLLRDASHFPWTARGVLAKTCQEYLFI